MSTRNTIIKEEFAKVRNAILEADSKTKGNYIIFLEEGMDSNFNEEENTYSDDLDVWDFFDKEMYYAITVEGDNAKLLEFADEPSTYAKKVGKAPCEWSGDGIDNIFITEGPFEDKKVEFIGPFDLEGNSLTIMEGKVTMTRKTFSSKRLAESLDPQNLQTLVENVPPTERWANETKMQQAAKLLGDAQGMLTKLATIYKHSHTAVSQRLSELSGEAYRVFMKFEELLESMEGAENEMKERGVDYPVNENACPECGSDNFNTEETREQSMRTGKTTYRCADCGYIQRFE